METETIRAVPGEQRQVLAGAVTMAEASQLHGLSERQRKWLKASYSA
jgi:hypothetical protein